MLRNWGYIIGGQTEIKCYQTFQQTFGLKPVIRRCLYIQQDAAEHAQRHID